MRRLLACVLVMAFSTVFLSSPASGWGKEGHRIATVFMKCVKWAVENPASAYPSQTTQSTQPSTQPTQSALPSNVVPVKVSDMGGGNIQFVMTSTGQAVSSVMPAAGIRAQLINDVIGAWPASNLDDITRAINVPDRQLVISPGSSMAATVSQRSGTLSHVVVYCPKDKIRQGIVVSNGATVTLDDVMVVGSWQGLNFGGGAKVTLRNVRVLQAQTWSQSNPCANNAPRIDGQCRGDQGGYATWSDAATVTFSGRCVFHCRSEGDQASTQYAWRSSGTTITSAEGSTTYFWGSPSKFFCTRMTCSTGNTLINCEWHGGTVSFGGGSGGPGVGNFAGTITDCTFDLAGNNRVTAQPGVNGLKFVRPKFNKDNWIAINAQATNVTVTQ